MTITEQLASAPEAPASTEEGREHQRWFDWPARRQLLLLSLLIAGGLLLRLILLMRGSWLMDADESVLGIMANHIRHGERPIFFYGQAYMGTLQAYGAAVLYTIFGMSRFTFKSLIFIEFVAFAISLYALARRTYDANSALLAVGLAALPPVYVWSVTGRLLGPIVETMTIGNLILLLAIDEAYGTGHWRYRWLRYLVIGLLGGFGFWLHGQTVIYLAAAGLLLFLHDKRIVINPALIAAVVGGFIVGALPAINFSLQYDYTPFHHLLGIGADDVPRHYLRLSYYYLRTIVPRIAGLAVPWAPLPLWIKGPAALVMLGACASFLYHHWRGMLGWLRLSLAPGRPGDALALFGLVMSAAFVTSNFGNLHFLFPTIDVTGRYAIPLESIIPIILAGEIMRWSRRSLPLGALATGILLLLAIAGYARSSPTAALESPYWPELPASNANLIATLDQMQINAVWMIHWAGKPLIFDSQERISAADYVDLKVWHGVDRLGNHTRRVEAATLPGYVFVTDSGQVPLEDWLRQQGVPFEKRVLDHYVVIQPLQPVDPARFSDLLQE